MGKGEPMLKDLPIHAGYTIVPPDLTLPEAAQIFVTQPDSALIVHSRDENTFLGVAYLHDLHNAYSNLESSIKSPHKSKINEIMNKSISEIGWKSNITQAIALISLQSPHGIIIRDENGKFAGFLSSRDLDIERRKLNKFAKLNRGI